MTRGLLWVLLLCFAAVAAADDAPVIRHAALGFNHQFRNRHWTPLRVEIENPGPERRAVLVVEPLVAGNPRVSQPVWLPANSRRSTWLTVYAEVGEAQASDRKKRDTIPTVFHARLTDGALKVWSGLSVLGKPVPENALVALVADARQSSYRFPSVLPADAARRPLARWVVLPAELPARALDFDGVNLLVLGQTTRPLLAMQWEAITQWVRMGGTLVVPASPQLPGGLYAEDFLWLDRLATEPRLDAFGARALFPSGIGFRRLRAEADAVWLGDRDSPLGLRHREGLGQVITLALDSGDPEFQRWPGVTNFLARLMETTRQAPPAADRFLQRHPATDALLSQLAGIKVLGRGALLGYLTGVVGLLLVVLVAFRFTARPERGWAMAGLLALGMAAAAMTGARLWKSQPEPFLNEINLLLVSRDGRGVLAQSALGLYSPQADTFTLSGPRGTLRLRTVGEAGAMELHDQLRLPGLALRAQDLRVMYGQAALTGMVAPVARAELTPAGLSLVVSNPTARSWEDCFLKIQRLVVPLGDLPAGATRTFRGLTGTGAFSGRAVQSSEEQLRAALRRIFFPEPIYTLSRQTTATAVTLRQRLLEDWAPAVYGWSREPVFPLTPQRPLAHRSVSLWAVETPVRYAGPRVELPAGVMPLRLLTPESRQLERGEGRYSGTRGASLTVAFQLPEDCPDLRVDRARLVWNFRGTAYRYALYVVGADGRRQRLEELTIPEAGQWFVPATRSLSIAVEIEPVAAEMAGVNYWQIRELDLELGGTPL